jgi:prevent-host-death family protein
LTALTKYQTIGAVPTLYKTNLRENIMSKMTTVEARENFSELINQAAYGNKRIVLTRRGRPLVAVVSISDLQRLGLSEEDKK